MRRQELFPPRLPQAGRTREETRAETATCREDPSLVQWTRLPLSLDGAPEAAPDEEVWAMGPRNDLPGLPGWPRDGDANASAAPDKTGAQGNVPARRMLWSDPPGMSPSNRALMLPPAGGAPPIVVDASTPGPQDGPTLTRQMRTMQPPDVARQAMSELGVLASELHALPDALAEAGLARTHLRAYLEAIQDYLDLCRYAWEAVAEEQLEQVGAEAEYRQRAVAVARRIQRLKQDSTQATAGGQARPPRLLPFLWRRRVHLVRQGLSVWRKQLEPVPNPLLMGRALFALQGYVGLASAGGLELVLLDLLLSTTLALLGLLTIGAVFLLVASMFGGGTAHQTATDAVIAATAAISWTVVLVFGVLSPLPLGQLMGASVFVPARAACLGWHGSQVVAALLRVWWLAIGSVGMLLVPVALVLGGVALAQYEPLRAPTTVLDVIAVAGVVLYVTLLLAAVVAAAALLLLALPFVVAALARFVRELAGNVHWVPAARRYVLPSVLAVVIFVTVLLLAATWYVGTALAWEHIALVQVDIAFVHGTLTLRGLAFMVVVALPYLLLFDLPYRIGIGRWRTQRLADLEARRLDLESQVRRLATLPATEELLRAMQYDLVLLQFYRGQIDEARATSTAPYRVEGRALTVVISIVGALILDSGGGVVFRLLTGQH